MAANYDSNGHESEWDGMTSEDLLLAEDGSVDREVLAGFGPLELWFFGTDPGAAVSMTPTDALALVNVRLRVLGDDRNPGTRRALDILTAHILRDGSTVEATCE